MMKQANTQPLYLIRPCTIVYLALMLLTVLTWLIGKTDMGGLEISLLVLGFALIKALLIGDYYMGLRSVSGIWRWAIIIWLVIPGGLITWSFVSAS